MSKYEKIAILISLALAILGLVYGLKTEGVNFARAGALIVIVGVIYGLLDLPSRLANIDSWARKQANNIRSEVIESIKAEHDNEKNAETAYEKAIEEAINEINKKAKKARQRLIFVEGVILVLGTLIWGFGDLINPVCCCAS